MAYGRERKYQALFGGKQPYFAPDVEAKPIPIPVGGWDSISPISAMDPKFAVGIDNWVVRPGYIELRGGYNHWAQGLGTQPVETLMVYRAPTGSETMFACANNTVYNVSTYGVPSIGQSSRLNNRCQYVNFTPGGSVVSYLLFVNGQDNYTAYNGSAFSSPVITGISASSFINIAIHKRRLWFIPVNSTSAYYLATDAIAGAATQFDLAPLLNLGGYLMAMGTWTVDGGVGPDDMAVFVSSKGQCVIYKGTDPSNSNAWALVGVFDLPPPIGRRCLVKLGSDLGIITLQGLIPISQALPFDPSSVRSVSTTNRIQNSMLTSALLYNQQFGWEAKQFPGQSLLVLNIPQQANSTQVQYVMNTLTGAWFSFSGWNANTFEIFNNSLYFGGNSGQVALAYCGATDLASAIIADVKCAFNYFDDPGRIKNISMVKPLIICDGLITPTLSIDVDFADNSVSAPVTVVTPSGAVWDTSIWDTATWSTGASTVNNWLSVNAVGTALALRTKVNITTAAGGGSNTNANLFDYGVFDTMVFDGNGQIVQSGTGLLTLQINSFEAIMQFGGPI